MKEMAILAASSLVLGLLSLLRDHALASYQRRSAGFRRLTAHV